MFEPGCISDSLDRSQRGMMTGRRPLDDISTFQSAFAYHEISDMLAWLQFTLYLPEIGGFTKQVETNSKSEQQTAFGRLALGSGRLNVEGLEVAENELQTAKISAKQISKLHLFSPEENNGFVRRFYKNQPS